VGRVGGASRQGGRPDLVWRRGGGSPERLVHSGGDWRWGKKVGKPEWGSPAGSERLGMNYSAARSSGWGQWGRRGARATYPQRLSDGEQGDGRGRHKGSVGGRRKKGDTLVTP
jgi:hypothetical protein